MWKVCHLEFGHEESICQNLSEHKSVQAQVQIRTNNFEMVGNYLSTIPAIVYSFFVGSLSDKYGRKPCILFPLFGCFFGTLLNFVNYIWIRELPTEFFYVVGDAWYSILGGNSVYYLGAYGLGSSITTKENRANLLGKQSIYVAFCKIYV